MQARAEEAGESTGHGAIAAVSMGLPATFGPNTSLEAREEGCEGPAAARSRASKGDEQGEVRAEGHVLEHVGQEGAHPVN